MAQPRVIDVNKLALIRTTADALARLPYDEVNLLFYEAGLSEFSQSDWVGDYSWQPDDSDRRQMVTRVLRDLGLADLTNLATAMHQLFASDEPTTLATEPEPLNLFASHLTKQKELVHQVADILRAWGITMFVAHDDIEPDAEWHAAIEAALQRADAGVVFLYPGIAQSSWCDQEIGWLLGRGVPVRALKFSGQDPYGPLGKQQALTVHATATARLVAVMILDWAEQRPALAGQTRASLVSALANSGSFDKTNAVWGRIEHLSGLTGPQVAVAASAIRDNDQVYGAEYRQAGPNYGKSFPEVALRFLRAQPGHVENEALVLEVAQARGIEAEVFS